MSERPGGNPLPGPLAPEQHGFTNKIVHLFLHSNLPLVLVLLAVAVGATSLLVTPREEDPQIVVPLADVYVNFPGHNAQEVEQLVSTPLEKILYQIDGVEYVYSMSKADQAIITVRFYVGEDRERSLVKIRKKIDENTDIVPPGVTGWVIKPVEIDDVPIVTLTLSSPTAGEYALRRVAEELVERLAAVRDTSRAAIVGGLPRIAYVYLDPNRMRAYQTSPLQIQKAIAAANVTVTAGQFSRHDTAFAVETGKAFADVREMKKLVVGRFGDGLVLLKDVAEVVDGPAEVTSYVRHGWGPARGVDDRPAAPGSLVGEAQTLGPEKKQTAAASSPTAPAVTIAIAKKKGANAVTVAKEVIAAAGQLRREVVPHDMQLVVTRNSGLNADDKVNELIEALAVALVIAVAVLTLGLGWRESFIVAVAVPVVFGLTLAVNLLAGLTINRVTLFALILSLGLLVDDPIVDVENIVRHFRLRGKATRGIVLEAVSEIRPPLIAATLAVIVSFLPLLFITGMMGPYMRPMALNVPVTMIMSMVVAFTITPWLTHHLLKKHFSHARGGAGAPPAAPADPHDDGDVTKTFVYRLFYPLMAPLLKHRGLAWGFLAAIGVLMVLAMMLALTRHVPLKMLPYGNKNELQLVLNFDEGTTLERADAAVREFERYVATVPEVTDYTSYVGLAAPMDFNGMVRHYYLRRGDNVADIQVNMVDRNERSPKTHTVALRLREDLTALAARHGVRLKIVEAPPGPPVLSTVVAEVTGQPGHSYTELIAAARTVEARMKREPGVVDVDDYIEAPQAKLVFSVDKEKAALHDVTVAEIDRTVQAALSGLETGIVQLPRERNPLRIVLLVPRPLRSGIHDLASLHVAGQGGNLVQLGELGRWSQAAIDRTIYHKNLHRVVYVLAETAGRTPAEVVLDVKADQNRAYREPDSRAHAATSHDIGSGWMSQTPVTDVAGRSFFSSGGGIGWGLPAGIDVDFAGEGEWNMTIDVFRDMGLAFVAALIAIYIILIAQMRSFVIPIVVMLAIPLTIIGIMPGFWLLNAVSSGRVGPYADPVFFTATGMIGMIALAGIVTRSSIIIVDFIHLSLSRGRSLFDAIIESCVVRLRPILLTASVAMLSAVPITIDPIFSGLAWSLIFGLLASTVFTLFVIPVVYWLLYAHKPGHGVNRPNEDA